MAIADTDPQGSGLAWYERRGALVGPDVVGITLREVRNAVSSAKPQYDLLLLDTPGQMTASNDALALADLALIPCRPTIADAAPRMHATANGIAKSTAFVITQVPPRGERRGPALPADLAEQCRHAPDSADRRIRPAARVLAPAAAAAGALGAGQRGKNRSGVSHVSPRTEARR